MSSLTYDALVAELFPRLTGGIRWGLERTQRMLAEVGDPHRALRVVHVGGTNGKGSVAAHIESVLRHDGRRIGLYSSPHLCTFRERIRIDGAAIGEAALLAAAQRLWPAIQRERPSFFEATTAIAFLALADAGVELAVIEVGLGGRLDATNVVHPDVVVLSNVSLDHVQLLGPTVEHIAREKAGIIKPGVAIVTAETGEPALSVFRAAADAAGARLDVLEAGHVQAIETSLDGTRFRLHRGRGDADLSLRTRLPGAHQATNAALAARALASLKDPPSQRALEHGLADVRWPGRLQVAQRHGVTWLLDVAHNVAGVEALAAALGTLPVPRPIAAVIGVLGDKDWQGMLLPLYEVTGRVWLTVPPTAPPERRWDPATVLRAADAGHAAAQPDFTAALQAAYRFAAHAGGCVLVTGSFHTVGDALAVLGMCPDGADSHMPSPVRLDVPHTAQPRPA